MQYVDYDAVWCCDEDPFHKDVHLRVNFNEVCDDEDVFLLSGRNPIGEGARAEGQPDKIKMCRRHLAWLSSA